MEKPKHNYYTMTSEEEVKLILQEYKDLIKVLEKGDSQKEDFVLVKKAFKMASESHKNMRRKSGDPYILHPIAVAKICVEEIGLGRRSCIAALLHDVVEDTDITLQDIGREFGEEMVSMVDSLTKIGIAVDSNLSQQSENFKRILFSLTKDPRVIFIKIADRLHNMRTLPSMKHDNQLKTSSETVFFYVPLANRLGLYSIKTELEDLSMKYLQPGHYKEIANKLSIKKEQRVAFLAAFITEIKDILKKSTIEAEVIGRPKSIASIWNKMQRKGVSFEEIYDLSAVRIILPYKGGVLKEKELCWKVYNVISNKFQSIPHRLRDFLNHPKLNGYQALHLTILSSDNKLVEIQIRTARMDEINERGLAAHWKYKEGIGREDQFDKWFQQIAEMLSTQEDTDTFNFLEEFTSNLRTEEIIVYTPKGDIKTLPKDASVLDFAFEIHSDLAKQCIGAKVNHQLVSFEHKLNTGDQVQILTSNKQKPTEDWLKYVVSSRAINSLKYLLREDRKQQIIEGQKELQQAFYLIGANHTYENIKRAVRYLKLANGEELYYKLAIGQIDLSQVMSLPVYEGNIRFQAKKFLQKITSFISIPSNVKEIILEEDTLYSVGTCCKPIQGDDVFAVQTEEGLVLHTYTCKHATKLFANYANKIIRVKWGSSDKSIVYEVTLSLSGVDNMGLINKLTQIISEEMKVDIKLVHIESKDVFFQGYVKVLIHNRHELNQLQDKLSNIEGIKQIDRE
ncbi:MAG: RelA/SpoT family protein [Chitinophagaceae bacterium]